MNKPKVTYELVLLDGTYCRPLGAISMERAMRAARTHVLENAEPVYLKWFRESDGQKGFLNPSGDHSIKGYPWEVKAQ